MPGVAPLSVPWRARAMAQFFTAHPGPSPSRLGLGRALVEFLEWEVDSGRVRDGGGSRWWSAVNEKLVRDLDEAGQALADGSTPVNAAARAWVDYAGSGPEDAQRLLWRAHQRSIGAAVHARTGLLVAESRFERRFIELVMEVLEDTARACRPTDTGALGHVVRKTYPDHYPIGRDELAAVIVATGRGGADSRRSGAPERAVARATLLPPR